MAWGAGVIRRIASLRGFMSLVIRVGRGTARVGTGDAIVRTVDGPCEAVRTVIVSSRHRPTHDEEAPAI